MKLNLDALSVTSFDPAFGADTTDMETGVDTCMPGTSPNETCARVCAESVRQSCACLGDGGYVVGGN